MRPGAAFTLIELLVVITIIVVLLALLTPALDRAVYQAQLAACGSNLHGIAVGGLTYAAHFKRHYPYRTLGAEIQHRQPHHIAGFKESPATEYLDERPQYKGFIDLKRRDAWTMFEAWKKSTPGFEDAYFVASGPYIGVRETRRLVGRCVLTEGDIFRRRRFADAIATGCWYLDVHPNEATAGTANKEEPAYPGTYDIPYGSLLPRKIENLLVAGRCHSATGAAASSTRVTATATAMGEAAGTAAAMAVRARTSAAEIDATHLRRELAAQGAGPFTDA